MYCVTSRVRASAPSAASRCSLCCPSEGHATHHSAGPASTRGELHSSCSPFLSPVVARASAVEESNKKLKDETKEALPLPTIKIDNHSDSFATIVKVDFGDRLGELLDTVQALKNLGYNIARAKLAEDSKNKFFITCASSGEKVTKSADLEDIRQCIIHTMVDFHPESERLYAMGSAESSAAGEALGIVAGGDKVKTSVKLVNESGEPFTRMHIITADRPGLLVDVVRTLKDCNCNVLSAEVDTIGAEAQDDFILTYHGEPLQRQMRLLVKNALHYYLALSAVEKEESY